MYTETAEQDGEDAGGQLLICTSCFPISHRAHVDGLQRLITGTDGWRQLGLAGRTILRRLIVNGATFRAESGHVVDFSGEILSPG